MSAQLSFPAEESDATRPGLTLVPPLRSTVSTVGFGLIILVLLAFGMGLVMVVTTSVAAQSKELSGLRTEATQLEYKAANLTTQLQARSNTASLVMRATDAGMVPNPNPVFIRLSEKKILGDAKPVAGDEAPYLQRVAQTPATTLQISTDEAVEATLPVAPGGEQ